MKEKKKLTYKQQQQREKAKTIIKWVFCGLGWSLLATAFISLLVVGIRGCNNNKNPKSTEAYTGTITTPVKPVSPNNLVYLENEDTSQYEGNMANSDITNGIVNFFRGNGGNREGIGMQYTWRVDSGYYPRWFSVASSSSSNYVEVAFYNQPLTGLSNSIPRPEQISDRKLAVAHVSFTRATFTAYTNNQLWYTIDELREMALEGDDSLTYDEVDVDIYKMALRRETSNNTTNYFLDFYDLQDNLYSIGFAWFTLIYTSVLTTPNSWYHVYAEGINFKLETYPFSEDSIRYDRYLYSQNNGSNWIPGLNSLYQGVIVSTYVSGYGVINSYSGGSFVDRYYGYNACNFIYENFSKTQIYYNSDITEPGDNPGIPSGGIGGSSYENFFTLIAQAFRSIASILNIQVLPGVTIGTLVFIPLIVTIVIFIIWLVKR